MTQAFMSKCTSQLRGMYYKHQTGKKNANFIGEAHLAELEREWLKDTFAREGQQNKANDYPMSKFQYTVEGGYHTVCTLIERCVS
ncbi:hypothetical protein CDL15_Pgr012699 [Punica granatum]|uniref:Uncharacterized protein n=1 Tax=Punica granatum TaxID=22663 RepID=A0A218XEI3_PUNGR|nr:hypothetical protein CDL15_Pgr012699 [Punica granatum]